jgi:phosphoglycolate phosphatase-like HAD superfamily hydrolase
VVSPPPIADLVVFDLDGTLLDSDQALAAAFVALGVAPEAITFGHVIADECERLGLELDDYLDAYDTSAAQPFPGVADMLSSIGRWAVCSNKHPRSGHAELARLGWQPEGRWFADAFDGPKGLGPVLDGLGLDAATTLYVGDTDHDREAAAEVGCRFVLAGWNPRAVPRAGDEVATRPGDVLRAAAGQTLSPEPGSSDSGPVEPSSSDS